MWSLKQQTPSEWWLNRGEPTLYKPWLLEKWRQLFSTKRNKEVKCITKYDVTLCRTENLGTRSERWLIFRAAVIKPKRIIYEEPAPLTCPQVNNTNQAPQGVLRISSDRDGRIGAKIKKPQKTPGPKFCPARISSLPPCGDWGGTKYEVP